MCTFWAESTVIVNSFSHSRLFWIVQWTAMFSSTLTNIPYQKRNCYHMFTKLVWRSFWIIPKQLFILFEDKSIWASTCISTHAKHFMLYQLSLIKMNHDTNVVAWISFSVFYHDNNLLDITLQDAEVPQTLPQKGTL